MIDYIAKLQNLAFRKVQSLSKKINIRFGDAINSKPLNSRLNMSADESKQSFKTWFKIVRPYLIWAGLISAAINMLALSGSLFMLQVYDRVIPSHSYETLQALVVLVVVLYSFSTLFENSRSRLFLRMGRFLDVTLGSKIFDLNIKSSLAGAKSGNIPPQKEFEQIRNFFVSGGPSALFDLPWMPLYTALLFSLNPLLGCLGLFGMSGLLTITLITNHHLGKTQKETQTLLSEVNGVAESYRLSSESILPMGMLSPVRQSWINKNTKAGDAIITNQDIAIFYAGLSRLFRLSLQSFALAIGAYLVITNKATGGIMIASSIILGKALSPVELAIRHWNSFETARQALYRLSNLMVNSAPEKITKLPTPSRTIVVDGLHVMFPGGSKPFIGNIGFSLEAGDVLGVIGPSGSGKSSLLRSLVGIWPSTRGTIRFDGSTLDQWSEDDRGKLFGYVPQSLDLITGTIGQNIGRFQELGDNTDMLRAAEAAGVDPFVRSLENGYDSIVGLRGEMLSAGQRQRVLLARALFGDPFVVLLDEPNSALDIEGEAALIKAILAVQRRNGIVVLATHKLSILSVANKVLLMERGMQKAFGSKDEILKRVAPPVSV